MKRPTETKPTTVKNQQNLNRFYWELNGCLQDNPDHQLASSLTETIGISAVGYEASEPRLLLR